MTKDLWKALAVAAIGYAGGSCYTALVLSVAPDQNWKDLDIQYRARGPVLPTARIQLVCIDDATVKAAGGGIPIPRKIVSDIIKAVRKDRPRAIGVYLVLGRPSRYGIADDASFQASCREIPPLVLAADTAKFGNPPADRMNLPLSRFIEGGAQIGVVVYGFVNGLPRSAPLAIEMNGRVWPSMAESLARIGTPVQSPPIVAGQGNKERREILINFIGPRGSFPRVSALGLLRGSVRPGRFEDSIVLIGPTARSWADFYETPRPLTGHADVRMRRRSMEGLEVQANVVHTYLTKSEIHMAGRGALLVWGTTLPLLIALLFMCLRRGWTVLAIAAALLLEVASHLVSTQVFSSFHVVLEHVTASWTATATLIAAVAWRVVEFLIWRRG